MRSRADRRYALLLGLVLSLWAVTNDLALFPPDLDGEPAAPPAPEVREAPAPRPPPTTRPETPDERGRPSPTP